MGRHPSILDTPRAGYRRCLGPGREHGFRSPDKTNCVVCPQCRFRSQAPQTMLTAWDARGSRKAVHKSESK